MNLLDGPRVLIMAIAVLAFQLPRAVAEPLMPTEQDDQATSKPTEIGIRFTPQMAEAMSKKFLSEMKPRYDLDDKQVAEISPIQRQLEIRERERRHQPRHDRVDDGNVHRARWPLSQGGCPAIRRAGEPVHAQFTEFLHRERCPVRRNDGHPTP
jgi:hypothetical protein